MPRYLGPYTWGLIYRRFAAAKWWFLPVHLAFYAYVACFLPLFVIYLILQDLFERRLSEVNWWDAYFHEKERVVREVPR